MMGVQVRDLRVYLELTEKELAKIAKVSTKAVYLFEHSQPMPLDDKRKILTVLYARKIGKYW